MLLEQIFILLQLCSQSVDLPPQPVGFCSKRASLQGSRRTVAQEELREDARAGAHRQSRKRGDIRGREAAAIGVSGGGRGGSCGGGGGGGKKRWP